MRWGQSTGTRYLHRTAPDGYPRVSPATGGLGGGAGCIELSDYFGIEGDLLRL